MKNLNEFMQQAKQMQERMQKLQDEAAAAEVVGEAGAGLVRVRMSGRHDVRQVSIDPGLLQEDVEVLEDLLAAAVNDAVRKVEARQKELLGGLAAGIPLPPGFKLPF